MHIDLTKGVIKQHMFKLAAPAVVGYLFHTLFNITDTYFAGTISTPSLAALSLSASVFFMILAVAIGMSEAVTSMVGNALGEKETERAKHITLNAIVFAVLLSVVLSLLGMAGVPYLVDVMGDPSYVKETMEYINPILYTAVLFVGSFFFNALLNAMGDTKSFRDVLIFTAFLNILLDYMFIEYFDMGMLGIAIATIICEAIIVSYLFYRLQKTKLRPSFSSFHYDQKVVHELLKQGFPPSVNMFLMAFGMYVITYFVAPFGKEAVGAFGIGMRVEQIFLMPVVGLNIATLAIVAQNNGAKEFGRIPQTLHVALKYGWIISTIGVLSYLLFAEYFASLLTSDSVVIEQTALYLRISGLASYGFVVIFIYIAMLQGIAKPAVILPVSVYRQIIAPVVVFTLLSIFGFGILAMWISLDLIIFSSALFLWWYGEKSLKKLLYVENKA